MRLTHQMRAAGVLAALVLVIPASASAVPSVSTVIAKTGDAGVTYLTDPTGAALTTTQKQYVVSADGYVLAFKEDNGVTGGGVLDYSVLPSAYRAPMTPEEKRAYAPAQTDLQPHATCSGVAALSSGPNILAWQAADPAYNYVPWQKTTAGLGDDPTKWIPVVKTATGVDLATLSSVASFTTACTGLGGTYHAADTSAPIANALIANALAPLQTQLTTLQKAKDKSDATGAADKAARKVAEDAYSAFFVRPIAITLAAKRFAPQNGVVMVTGSATDPVTVTLDVTKKQKSALGLSSRVLAEANGTIGADGAVLLTLKPDRVIAKRLTKRLATSKRPIPVTILAVSGGNEDSATATLTLAR
ncbi:MAG: hypothetical protein WBD55_07405 [Dehalococcoidia bacterium]